MHTDAKPWFKSKTIWVNFICFAALVIQQATGHLVPIEVQGYALVIVNIVLRAVTKTGIHG